MRYADAAARAGRGVQVAAADHRPVQRADAALPAAGATTPRRCCRARRPSSTTGQRTADLGPAVLHQPGAERPHEPRAGQPQRHLQRSASVLYELLVGQPPFASVRPARDHPLPPGQVQPRSPCSSSRTPAAAQACRCPASEPLEGAGGAGLAGRHHQQVSCRSRRRTATRARPACEPTSTTACSLLSSPAAQPPPAPANSNAQPCRRSRPLAPWQLVAAVPSHPIRAPRRASGSPSPADCCCLLELRAASRSPSLSPACRQLPVSDFPVGRTDVLSQFRISQKLYGREEQVKRPAGRLQPHQRRGSRAASLTAASQQAASGPAALAHLPVISASPCSAPSRPELVLIAGYSGIGQHLHSADPARISSLPTRKLAAVLLWEAELLPVWLLCCRCARDRQDVSVVDEVQKPIVRRRGICSCAASYELYKRSQTVLFTACSAEHAAAAADAGRGAVEGAAAAGRRGRRRLTS